jgi:hypothetical protein
MTATERAHSPTPEDLMAFVDGELLENARAGIQAHLGACAQCRAVVDDLRGVTREMTEWRVEEAPAALAAPRVGRASGFALPPISWHPRYVSMTLGAVAITAVLVFITLDTASERSHRELPVSAEAREKVLSIPNGALDGSLPSIAAPAAVDRFGGGGGGRGGRPGQAQREFQQRTPSAGPVPAPEETLAAMTAPPPAEAAKVLVGQSRQPSVIRTATLRLVASDFDEARSRVEGIVAQDGGFLDQITVTGTPGAARTLTGSLRVPSTSLADALNRLRQLGQVTEDTQGSEDVTDQLVDLDVRLANARATEQRLNDILKNRTGKLSDVLEVEQAISRVRLEIEQMDAQRLNTSRRVTYSTITLQIDEVRKAGLESGPLSLTTRLRVAAADGLEAAMESVVGTVLFILRAGPVMVMWLAAGTVGWAIVRRRWRKA